MVILARQAMALRGRAQMRALPRQPGCGTRAGRQLRGPARQLSALFRYRKPREAVKSRRHQLRPQGRATCDATEAKART